MCLYKMALAVLCLCLLSACSITKSDAGATSPQGAPRWDVLVSETQTPIQEPRQMVVKTQQEFDTIWNESQNGITMGPSKPSVDFTKKWVIAVFLGWVKSAGHRLEIQSVQPGSAATIITLVHRRPGPGCVTAQVIEMPYLFASVDHFRPERAEFKILTEDVKCE